jgi:hypothetical protein
LPIKAGAQEGATSAAEPRKDGVVEAGDGRDTVTRDGEDEQSGCVAPATGRVADVRAEGGLAVRPRRDQVVGATVTEDDRGVELRGELAPWYSGGIGGIE